MKERRCINCSHHFVCIHYRKMRDFFSQFHHCQRIGWDDFNNWLDDLAKHCREYMESKEE